MRSVRAIWAFCATTEVEYSSDIRQIILGRLLDMFSPLSSEDFC